MKNTAMIGFGAPWGYYERLDEGDRFQVKLIMVKPDGKLSLQLHHHRAEHWVVVSGTAKVTLNNDVSLIGPKRDGIHSSWHSAPA